MRNKDVIERSNIIHQFLGKGPTKLVFTSLSHSEVQTSTS
jgi:hypothetical protein